MMPLQTLQKRGARGLPEGGVSSNGYGCAWVQGVPGHVDRAHTVA